MSEVQLEALPKEPFEVTEKIDGALGILYRDPADGEQKIATRGSFTSEEAVWATESFRKWSKMRELITGKIWAYGSACDTDRYTYLFEICADTKAYFHLAMKKPGLYLIGMRDMYSLEELPPSKVREHAKLIGYPTPDSFDLSIDELLKRGKEIKATECEGWVLHYPHNGLKVKVKGLDYIRLARFLQSFSAKHVFEMVRDGQVEIPEGIPEMYVRRFNELKEQISAEFVAHLKTIETTFEKNKNLLDGTREGRKLFAAAVLPENLPKWIEGLVFDRVFGQVQPPRLWEGMRRNDVWKKFEKPIDERIQEAANV